jgi:hypothetical protein
VDVESEEPFLSFVTLVWFITLLSENIAPAAIELNAARS